MPTPPDSASAAALALLASALDALDASGCSRADLPQLQRLCDRLGTYTCRAELVYLGALDLPHDSTPPAAIVGGAGGDREGRHGD